MNKNEFNVEKFFDKHFSEMGEPKYSEEKDKEMLNNIMKHSDLRKNKNFFYLVKEYFYNFKLSSPKYAYPITGTAITLFFIFYFIFNNSTKINNNENTQLITDNKTAAIQDTIISDTNSDDIESNRIIKDEKTEKNTNINTFTSDFALVNYDFSTRSINNNSFDKNKVAQFLIKYFKRKNVNCTLNNDILETDWYISDNIQTKILIDFSEDNGEFKLKILQKTSKDKVDINENLRRIKNEIEERIIQEFAFQ